MSSSISAKAYFNDPASKNETGFKSGFFRPEDWDFIKSVSSRFPERKPSILERFTTFSWCPVEQRPMLALQLLKTEPRRGLMQRGYNQESVESIYDHSRKMSRLLGRIFKEDNEAKLKFPGNRARKILVHDIGEAITTDFTPSDLDRISAEEKVYLEDLAMRLIFEANPARYAAYVSYKNKETLDDELVKVADTLELLEDIEEMKVSGEIQNEITASCRLILQKYETVCRHLKVNLNL